MQPLRYQVIQVLWHMLLLAQLCASLTLPVAAQSNEPVLQIREVGNDVYVEWDTVTGDRAGLAAALLHLPVMRFQGYELPIQFVTLQLAQPYQIPTLQIEQSTSIAWPEAVQPAARLQPPTLDWTEYPDLMPQETVALPESPVFILRHGQIAGQPIAVLAISPLYQANGLIQLATKLTVKVVGATVVSGNLSTFLKTQTTQSANGSSIAPATVENLVPINGAVAGDAVKLIVSKPGLQRVSGQMLAAAALNINTIDLTNLHLYRNGVEIPLEISQSPAFELRFYARTVGDRWNISDTYWLTVEANNKNKGLRMAMRAVAPGSAPASQTALEKGVWERNLVYQSTQPGPDGDHWFHKGMEASPALLGNPTQYPTATVMISDSLPSASGTALVTFTLSTYYKAIYTLRVSMMGTVQDLAWNSAPQGVLVENWVLPLSTTAPVHQLDLTLLPDKATAGLNLDRIFWQRPVTLDFQQRGATFTGLPARLLYQWQNAPSDNGQVQLYDVTNPLAPVILTGATSGGFQDGPGAHDYLLAGPEVVQTPQAIAHKGRDDFLVGAGANALYIAPSAFMAALEPLRAHRSAQGYIVQLVNVQDIYDAWSYGQVSPTAIRTFLRYANQTWQPAPISVVMVGDATWDPHNYQGKNNTNLIPAYMANVDPWLGEAACENCYVQLDGENPVTGDGQLFKADMWIGRFPVKSVAELTAVVDKLIHYETNASMDAWRSTTVMVAGNYIKELDANGAPIFERAGDFAHLSDNTLTLFPAQAQVKRIYYDPYPSISDPQGLESWRIADSNQARATVMTELGTGAGLVIYNGHGNHWQWLLTYPAAIPNYLLNLYDPDRFRNSNHLFIQLSMTCFTTQFPLPAISGTTLDERVFLNRQGGTVAVWGSAGMSVASGHIPRTYANSIVATENTEGAESGTVLCVLWALCGRCVSPNSFTTGLLEGVVGCRAVAGQAR